MRLRAKSKPLPSAANIQIGRKLNCSQNSTADSSSSVIELIDTFIRPLHENRIRYFVTGSVASMIYGEPRLTNDIDLVLSINSTHIAKLIHTFPEADYYLPPSEVMETEILRGNRGHFNIISQINFLKADIYLVGNDAMQRWGAANVRYFDIENLSVPFAPPEYVIIRKLEFYREGGSEKHLRDIASILTESPNDIDHDFLEKHLTALGLTTHYDSAKSLMEKKMD